MTAQSNDRGKAQGRGFFFIRHGETVANRDGVRSGGECETYLTQRGCAQAKAVGLALSEVDIRPGIIISSALSRTLETVRILNDRLRLEITVEKELNERLLGDWNGRPVTETQSNLAAGETPPNGESSALFRERVMGALRRLTPLYPQWPVIVSSRGIARVLLEAAGYEKGVTGVPNGGVLRVTLADAANLTDTLTDDFKIAAVEHIHHGDDDGLSPGDN